MSVRLARIDEVPVVITFLSQSEEFSTLASGHDVAYIIATFTKMMKEGRAWILILQDERGWLQGGLLFIKTTALYSGAPVAVKTSWYVAPKGRGRGMELLTAYEKMAGELGCEKAYISHLPNELSSRLEKVYARRGYRPTETTYVKELTTWAIR